MYVMLFRCRELWKRLWDCIITHAYREANGVADFLAKMGHRKDLGYHEFSAAPDQMKSILDVDKRDLLRHKFVYV